MREYKSTIDEIEVFIARSHHGAHFAPQLAMEVIRNHQQKLDDMKIKVNAIHENVLALKDAYSSLVRKMYGDDHDYLRKGNDF